MTDHYVGIDLGGTNLKLGLVDASGRIEASHSLPTEASGGPEHVLGRMVHAVRDLCAKAGAALERVPAIGIGAPGPLDTRSGRVVFAPNLPRWRDVAVTDFFEDRLGRPTRLENDANVAAYGEFRCGAGRDVRSMVALTLGTGVGGGIILGGKLLRGTSDTAAELGHVIVRQGGRRCGCGARGCLEAYASCTAVVARAREAAEADAASSLAAVADPSCKDVFDAAEAGDALARRVVDETAEYLGVGITSILHVLNPDMVVLTGGMMGAGEPFLDRVREVVRGTALERASSVCTIRASELGGDAGIIGAALAAEAFARTGEPG